MAGIDNGQVAARLRGLLSGQGEPGELAARLRVDETPLRMSVDPDAPYPTMDVIAAVVREYGVDPHWLLTGDYDPATHRESLHARPGEIPAVMNDVIRRLAAPSSPRPHVRLVQ